MMGNTPHLISTQRVPSTKTSINIRDSTGCTLDGNTPAKRLTFARFIKDYGALCCPATRCYILNNGRARFVECVQMRSLLTERMFAAF